MLTDLDLGYNNFMPRAAAALSIALKRNRGLKRLALSRNNLGPTAGDWLAVTEPACRTQQRVLEFSDFAARIALALCNGSKRPTE